MKKRVFLCVLALCILKARGDMVQIDFDIRDYDGNPVSGVNIKCCTREMPTVAYAASKTRCNDFRTDEKGMVCARFECWDGYVDCYLSANGYYQEELKDVIFRAPYEEDKGKSIFHETSKQVQVRLRKVKHPARMVFHRLFKTGKRLPAKSGRFGFDLEKGDWVAPLGNGACADVCIEYEWNENDKLRSCTGAVEFVDKGCGAYIKKKSPCKLMPVDYEVDATAGYKTYFPFALRRDLSTDEYSHIDILAKDEYLVVRSRVKLDSKGEVVSANYSQIHGPIVIGRYFSLGDWFFNPRVNDLNLEYEQPR